MADEYDDVLVESMLVECLDQLRVKAKNFPSRIVNLIKDISDLVNSNEHDLSFPQGRKSNVGNHAAASTATKIISARACIVCGRDDRPGEQRKSGFKCHDCIGLPSNPERFSAQVEEVFRTDKTVNEMGEKMINEFAFLHPLGRGSYGTVKLVVHNKSNQKYAAKILNKHALMRVHKAGSAQTAMDCVRTEISILKALSHPNIIKTYAVIDDPDISKLYMIMEYLEGGQVFHVGQEGDHHKPDPPIEEERLKKHVVGIARGLQYLHQKNIVHRDIKPENILLDAHDNVKLTDFGVSSSCTDDDDTMERTEGSPAYFPPEEYEQKPVKGKAHDIWSFGVTLYAMAFGKLPFMADSRQALGELIIHAEPEYPEDANPLLVDLIKRMLHKDQDHRISAGQVCDHPFVADVRTVKGFPVETVKVNVHVTDMDSTTLQKCGLDEIPSETELLLVKLHSGGVSEPNDLKRGARDMVAFFEHEGPDFQIIRSGTYCATFYSIRNDPRRKHLRSQSQMNLKSLLQK